MTRHAAARAALPSLVVLLGAAPSALDVAPPPAYVLAQGIAGAPVSQPGAAQCARAFASIAAKAKQLAEQNAGATAHGMGGSARVTLSTIVRARNWDGGATLADTAPRCNGGGVAASVAVVRSATIPLPPPPTDADRARTSSDYELGTAEPPGATVRLAEPAIYATASVLGADDRPAGRLAAERARRAAADLALDVDGVAAVVSFEPSSQNATRYRAITRFFYPPATVSAGIALHAIGNQTPPRYAADARVRLVVPRPYVDTIVAPFETAQPVRTITVEGTLPADDVIVSVLLPNRPSQDVVGILRKAGIDARRTSPYMIQPMLAGAEASAPADDGAVQALIAHIREALPDPRATIVSRPHIASCDAVEGPLRRAAFTLLDARSPFDVWLGPVNTTQGTCGATGYLRSQTSSPSVSVIARMTVAIMP